MRLKMDDRTVVDTDKAQAKWDEASYFNGNNHISKATGSQWVHQTLYLSSKNRYYIVSDSQWQASVDTAWLVSDHEAVEWLLTNGHEVPADLMAVCKEVLE